MVNKEQLELLKSVGYGIVALQGTILLLYFNELRRQGNKRYQEFLNIRERYRLNPTKYEGETLFKLYNTLNNIIDKRFISWGKKARELKSLKEEISCKLRPYVLDTIRKNSLDNLDFEDLFILQKRLNR